MDHAVDNMARSSRAKRLLASCCYVVSITFGTTMVGGATCTSITDPTQQTINILEDAVRRMSNASSSWQTVMQETIDSLGTTAQSTIRNELTELVQRGTAALATSAMCYTDFIRQRMIQDVSRIIARLRGVSLPPPEPYFCESVPSAVDMGLPPASRNKIDIYGYDFDRAVIEVLLENSEGTIDVSYALDRPTHYQMTLNLGANGVPLSSTSQRLILRWGGHEISSIAIIQPTTPICREHLMAHTPSPITFIPPHTRGDRNFAFKSGPTVDASVELLNLGDKIRAELHMTAVETKDDWTTAMGSDHRDIISATSGWRISEVGLATMVSSVHYTDNDPDKDTIRPGEGPVDRFEFVGNTRGRKEAGTDTKMEVFFVEIPYVEVEVGHCVPASAMPPP